LNLNNPDLLQTNPALTGNRGILMMGSGWCCWTGAGPDHIGSTLKYEEREEIGNRQSISFQNIKHAKANDWHNSTVL